MPAERRNGGAHGSGIWIRKIPTKDNSGADTPVDDSGDKVWADSLLDEHHPGMCIGALPDTERNRLAIEVHLPPSGSALFLSLLLSTLCSLLLPSAKVL